MQNTDKYQYTAFTVMNAVYWYLHISVLSRLKYSGMWCHFIWCVVTDILKDNRAKRLFDLKVKAAHSMLRIFSDHTSSVAMSCPKSPKFSAKLLKEFQISSLFVVCLLSLSVLFVYCHCQYLRVLPWGCFIFLVSAFYKFWAWDSCFTLKVVSDVCNSAVCTTVISNRSLWCLICV